MKVIFLDDTLIYGLTTGKIYEVKKDNISLTTGAERRMYSELYYEIVNNFGDSCRYAKHMFETIEDYRDNQINNIIHEDNCQTYTFS